MSKNEILKFLIRNGAVKDITLEKDGGYWWLVSKSLGMNENTMVSKLYQYQTEYWWPIYERCVINNTQRYAIPTC